MQGVDQLPGRHCHWVWDGAFAKTVVSVRQGDFQNFFIKTGSLESLRSSKEPLVSWSHAMNWSWTAAASDCSFHTNTSTFPLIAAVLAP